MHLAQQACEEARFNVGLQVVGGAELIALAVALVPEVRRVAGRAYHEQCDQHAYVHFEPVEAALQLLLHRCTDARNSQLLCRSSSSTYVWINPRETER